MLIRLQPVQIPVFWETIKFAITKADFVKDDNIHSFCNMFLQDLLSNKKICFVTYDEDKVSSIIIVSIKYNDINKVKSLFIHTIYSFKFKAENTWNVIFKDIITFAKKNSCTVIYGDIHNHRIWKLVENGGAKCLFKRFSYTV